MNWFSDVDRNTAFFYPMVRKRRNANGIHRLLVGHYICDDLDFDF